MPSIVPPDGGKITLLRQSTGEQAEARLTLTRYESPTDQADRDIR